MAAANVFVILEKPIFSSVIPSPSISFKTSSKYPVSETVDIVDSVLVGGKEFNIVVYPLDSLESVIYSINNSNDSFGFNVGKTYDNRDLLLYTDYYVLINIIIK